MAAGMGPVGVPVIAGVEPKAGGAVLSVGRAHIAEPLRRHINWWPVRPRRRTPAPRSGQSATLASMSFSGDDLARLRTAEEVDIETQPPEGPAHRTTIWLVVDGDEVFIRSVRGKAGRWYREATANPAVAVHVDGRRLPATAIPATDPDSIERTTAAVRRKYVGIEGFESMQNPEIFDATLRLEPA